MNKKSTWVYCLVIFLLFTLIGAVIFSFLLYSMEGRPGAFSAYLLSGNLLAARCLVGSATGLIAAAVICGGSYQLTGGVRRVPGGPYGDARFADERERRKIFSWVRFDRATEPGITLALDKHGCEVDTSDCTVLLVSPPGGGKTKTILVPTLLYNGHVNENTHGAGASILSVDCKGEEYQTTAAFMREKGYRTLLLDFRNPLNSLQFNMLHTVNQYMDVALQAEDPAVALEARANAERHAKMLADSISAATDIGSRGGDNPFFVETAKGLITAIVLLVSEFGEPEERHIVSVFRLIVELNGLLQEYQDGSNKKEKQLQKSRLGTLLDMLPGDVRAKLYAGAATSADVRTSMNVFASALSKLLAFLDAKLEQMVCAQSPGLTAKEFIDNPTCIYLVMPDEDNTAHFFATLFIQQMSTILVEQASEVIGGRLSRRVLVLWDEFGQSPPCRGMESWVTAWRSRGIRLLLALQTEDQLAERYGNSKAKVIRKTIQIRMYSHLSSDETAQELSKELGNYTVATQSVTNNDRGGSSSQSMTARPLLSNDEIGALPLGTWLVLYSGHKPILARLCPYDRVWRGIRPMLFEGQRKAVVKVPYLTEQKLYDRYGKDPLVGVLDGPVSVEYTEEEEKVFHNQR